MDFVVESSFFCVSSILTFRLWNPSLDNTRSMYSSYCSQYTIVSITNRNLQVSTPHLMYENYNNTTCGFCVTSVHENVSMSQGFLMEFLATSLLIYVVCSVWDPRNASTTDSVAIKFGLLITALSIAIVSTSVTQYSTVIYSTGVHFRVSTQDQREGIGRSVKRRRGTLLLAVC